MNNIYDHHIHLGYGNCRNKNRSQKYAGTALDNAYNNLLEYEGRGVTALRDGGDKDMLAFQLREEARNMGIRLSVSGRALVKKGRYGIHLGKPLSTMDDLKRELNWLMESGVDCIKVIQSGLVDVTGRPQEIYGSFSEKELIYIREITAEHGLPVMVHVNFADMIRSVVEAGMDSVEHGYFITEEILELMAKHQVAWTPTLAPFANALTYGKTISGWDQKIVKSVVEAQSAMVKRAAALKVPLLLGSDSGSSIVPHGRGSQDEYELLTALAGNHFS
ncbi:MAG TPA: amidohydrolase family protein [Clostridiales bacterium]|nr:amidohydrolase family protein [Clostridiales bacterium]